MVKKMNEPVSPATTERETAPVAKTQWIMPRQKSIERRGETSYPMSIRYPQVRGGVCEYCGVIDPNTPSQYQYKLCPHYRGMQLRCTYCPQAKDPDDVIYHSTLNIAEHPDNPETLVVWCDSYECSKKHLERFKIGV